MIDFSRTTFDKAIKTSVQAAAVQIESKFPMVRMQEVCTMKITDGTHQTPEYCSKDEGIPFLSSKDVTSQLINWNDLSIKYIPFELHEQLSKRISPQKDDVLLAKNGTIGIAALVEDDKVFDIYVTLAVLRPNKAIILPKYLHNIANSNICRQQYFSDISKGMGVPNLHLNKIKEVKIPLPPLDVQKSIVAECEHIDAEYQNAQEEIENTKKQISEIMSNVKGIKKQLGDMCEPPMYGANTAAKDGNPNNDYRYIRITDIDDDGNLNDDWKTAETIDEKYILKNGDVLFARSGATAGKTFLYTDKVGKALYAGYLIKFTPHKDVILPEYLISFTHTDEYLFWAKNTRGGTAQPNINAQQYSALKIPVPPLAEQQKIVAQITALEEKITTAKRTMTECPEKKQAVLDKWLR